MDPIFESFTSIGMTDEAQNVKNLLEHARNAAFGPQPSTRRHTEVKVASPTVASATTSQDGGAASTGHIQFDNVTRGIGAGTLKQGFDSVLTDASGHPTLSARVDMEMGWLGSEARFKVVAKDASGQVANEVIGKCSTKTGACTEEIFDGNGHLLLRGNSTSDMVAHPIDFTRQSTFTDPAGNPVGRIDSHITTNADTSHAAIDSKIVPASNGST